MKANMKQFGFSPVLVIVVIVAAGITGYMGYSYYAGLQKNDLSSVVEQNPIASDVQVAPELIESVSELNDADKLLDEMDLENTADNTQLDTELATF